jgi:hypothetical protein
VFFYNTEQGIEEFGDEVLMMHDMPRNIIDKPDSIEVVVESNNEDLGEDQKIDTLEGFPSFMTRCVEDQVSLGNRLNLN